MGNNITNIGSPETGTNNSNQVYQINERLTWLRGRHTLKFGGSWNYYRSESYYPGNNGQNGFISYTTFNFTGAPFADFLLDQVSQKGKGSTSDAWTHLQHRVGVLRRRRLQDHRQPDAEPRAAVGVHVAVRREGRSPGQLRSDQRAARCSRGRTATAARCTTPFYNGWEPRLGFAYRQGERWVFRGGYGITQYMEGTGANQRLPLNPPFFFESQVRVRRARAAPARSPPASRVCRRSTASPGSCAPGIRTSGRSSRSSGTCSPSTCSARGRRSTSGTSAADSTNVINDDRRQSAAAGHRRSAHLAADAAAPAALPVQPGHHVPHHDDSRGFRSDYNALQTTFKQRLWQGLDFTANYTLEQGDVEQPRLLRLGRRRRRHLDVHAGQQPRPRGQLRAGVLRRARTSSRWPAATSCRSAGSGRSAATGTVRSTRSRAAGR